MANRVQKNFKKQIKKYQKQRKKRENEEFYSYIEGDFINSYYEKKKKRRRIAISGVSIISFLILAWNIYAGSTWLNYAVYRITGKPLISFKETLDNKTSQHGQGLISIEEIFDSKATKRKAIYEYLDTIKEKNIDILAANSFNRYLENKNNPDLLKTTLEELETQKNETDTFITQLYFIKIPAEMKGYHQTLIKQMELYREIIDIMTNIITNRNLDSDADLVAGQIPLIQELHSKIKKFNYYNDVKHQVLIKVFEEANVKYEIYDGQIKYYRN